MRSQMVYKAKVDWWIGASIVLGLSIPVAVAILQKSWTMGAFSVCIWILVFGCCIPQWYETRETALMIRSGFITRVIPYSTIVAIRYSADSRSALALSLDRIEIESSKGKQLIAPKDQPAFMEDLSRKTPNLKKSGFDLVAN